MSSLTIKVRTQGSRATESEPHLPESHKTAKKGGKDNLTAEEGPTRPSCDQSRRRISSKQAVTLKVANKSSLAKCL